LGNIEPGRVRATLKSIAVKSPEDYQLIPSRCRARDWSRGFYCDPVTFNVVGAITGAVFEKAESPENADVDEVDEVSSNCYHYRDIADSRFSDP
jgi:hypothetical protein